MRASELRQLSNLFDGVLARHDDFAAQFYNELTETHPDLIGVFQRINMRSQHARFAGMLSILLNRICEGRPVQSLLADLGRQHGRYGVKDDDFEKFGTTLEIVLQRLAGAEFTPGLREAWNEVFESISCAMRDEMRDAGVTPHQV